MSKQKGHESQLGVVVGHETTISIESRANAIQSMDYLLFLSFSVHSGFEVLLFEDSNSQVSDRMAREIKVLRHWLLYILVSKVKLVAIDPLL